MKRLFIPIIAVFCVLGFTACGNAENSSSKTAETSTQAETVMHETQGDQTDEPIRKEQANEEKNDPASSDEQPQIADNDKGSGKDTIVVYFSTPVYIGDPIWWGDAPRIMSTFVEAHDFDGKTVIPFCTSGGSGIGRSGSNLASQAGSGNWLDGDRLDAGISESKIQDWINSMN